MGNIPILSTNASHFSTYIFPFRLTNIVTNFFFPKFLVNALDLFECHLFLVCLATAINQTTATSFPLSTVPLPYQPSPSLSPSTCHQKMRDNPRAPGSGPTAAAAPPRPGTCHCLQNLLPLCEAMGCKGTRGRRGTPAPRPAADGWPPPAHRSPARRTAAPLF